jgi:hypothetical protein
MNISIKEKDGSWETLSGDGLSAADLSKYETKLAYKAGENYELKNLYIQDDGQQIYYIHKYVIGENLFEEQDYIIF